MKHELIVMLIIYPKNMILKYFVLGTLPNNVVVNHTIVPFFFSPPSARDQCIKIQITEGGSVSRQTSRKRVLHVSIEDWPDVNHRQNRILGE